MDRCKGNYYGGVYLDIQTSMAIYEPFIKPEWL